MASWAGFLMIIAGASLLLLGLRGDPSRGRRRCPRCWYSLAGIPGLCCPECGHTAPSERALFRRRRNRPLIVAAFALALIGYETTRLPAIRTDGWAAAFPAAILRPITPLFSETATRLLIANTSLAFSYNQTPARQNFLATGPRFSRWERLLLSARCADIVGARADGRPPPILHATPHDVQSILRDLGADNTAVVAQLHRLLRADDAADRITAVVLLQACERPSARTRTRLQAAARSDPNDAVRFAALAALPAMYPRSPEAIDTVAALLDDPNHWVRYRAAGIIGEFGAGAGRALPMLRRRVDLETDVWAKNAAEAAILAIEQAAENPKGAQTPFRMTPR